MWLFRVTTRPAIAVAAWLRASTAAQMSQEINTCGSGWGSWGATQTRPGPIAFASYIAASARRRIFSADSDGDPVAIPTLALSGNFVRFEPTCTIDVDDAPGDDLGRHDVGALHDRQEFVAAEPADGDARADHRRDACADVAQHMVALFVTERVVHFLEPVEVDEQHRHVDPFALTELLRRARHGSAVR